MGAKRGLQPASGTPLPIGCRPAGEDLSSAGQSRARSQAPRPRHATPIPAPAAATRHCHGVEPAGSIKARRTLTLTTAPIFSSLSRMVPHGARAERVAERLTALFDGLEIETDR